MKQLIWDCQKDIAAYHPPESGISEHELVKMLMARLDGRPTKEAWETIGRAGARTMTAGTMTAAAPLLKIERWPDINRAAVGIGQAPLQLRSRRCHHLAWAYSPCSIQGNRFERRMPVCYSQRRWNQGKAGALLDFSLDHR